MRRMTDERGTVAIVVALALTTLMGAAALAIDVGAMLAARGALQNGADAAAIAVAKRCAENAAGPLACDYALVNGTASTYLSANTPSTVSASIDAGSTSLATSHGGRVGTVTVGGAITDEPIFARMLNGGAPLTVRAEATAHWAPVLATETVFPLVACVGALPPAENPVTQVVEASPTSPPGVCGGAPDAQAFGWTDPDDTTLCTSDLSTSPSDPIPVLTADAEPASCASAIDDLHDAIDSGSAAERTRLLAVYDAATGLPGARPVRSLVAFEFTGAKLDARTSHTPSGTWSPQCDLADPAERCIEGVVRYRLPSTSDPLATSAQASDSGIADTTVLDVRLEN